MKKKCPECKQLQLKRLIGAGAGVVFKGSGFYETDYRSDSYKKSEKAEKDSGKSKESSKIESSPKKESKDNSSTKNKD